MVVFSKKMSKQGLKGPELLERYKAYKNKDKERKTVQRKGQALSPSEVAKRKKLVRERVRKYRQRQKEKKAKTSSQDQYVSQAYQTPQALGKFVKVFFQLDSFSRQAPGRKEFVTVRENNTKHHIQKSHLLRSLMECYSIFMKENPTTEIGFNKFCSLRPVNVLLSADMPRDVCQNAL